VEHRLYQKEALGEFVKSDSRLWALLWERQSGKSTTLADFALYEMLRQANRTVIYASASLLLGQEITLKTAVRANQTARDVVENDAAVLKRFAETAQSQIGKNYSFKTFDAITGKEVSIRKAKGGELQRRYSFADFMELFRQQRLEFRVYFDHSSYSRTKVIAPNIATARSWSGTVLLDEVAFIRNLRELVTALLPVISTNKDFKLILSTTPPEFDDTHYSFELLAPPAGEEYVPNPAGTWYMSEGGIRVHRADAFDTCAAGKKIFDLKTGAVITPAEAFTRAPNKDGHRIAHWLWWMLGGSAACDLNRLKTAQERGAGGDGTRACQNFQIGSDAEMVRALNWLAENLGGVAASRQSAGNSNLKIGIGFDVATTTKGKSNPSVVSIIEERGLEWLVRARFIWRTTNPETANQRIHTILDTIEHRGLRPRAMAQDATNERYYAEQNRKHFRHRLPVILVVASQSVDKPGLDKPTNWKEYLGNQLIAKLDDNNLTLPSDPYTRADYRLVMKDRGKFVCEPNDQGMHGDCFDADKLAGYALTASSSQRTIIAPL